jgi:hypothetical protein
MGGEEMAAAGVRIVQDASEVAVVGIVEVLSHMGAIRRAMDPGRDPARRAATSWYRSASGLQPEARLARARAGGESSTSQPAGVGMAEGEGARDPAARPTHAGALPVRGRLLRGPRGSRDARRPSRRGGCGRPRGPGGAPPAHRARSGAGGRRPPPGEQEERGGAAPAAPAGGGAAPAGPAPRLPVRDPSCPHPAGLLEDGIRAEGLEGVVRFLLGLSGAAAGRGGQRRRLRTATLDATLAGLTMVVVYRMRATITPWGESRVRVDHVALANLVAGRRVVPELIRVCVPADRGRDRAYLKGPRPRGPGWQGPAVCAERLGWEPTGGPRRRCWEFLDLVRTVYQSSVSFPPARAGR